MKIAVIGAGGVGGYFGAQLARSGNQVSFVARGKHFEALKQSGLVVKSPDEAFHIDLDLVSDRVSDIENVDLIILAVKAWQVRDIAATLKHCLIGQPMIIPLQNGVSAIDDLAEFLPRKQIFGGLCRIISRIESPGTILHSGVTPTIIFGELDGSLSERGRRIAQCFLEAGFKGRLVTNIQQELWKKFISICSSGLLALCRASFGVVREVPETRQMMKELFSEIFRISERIGIGIEADFVDKTLSFMDTIPYESTASLSRDIWEGKPSEIQYQNGAVVALGEKFGIDTPVNRFIYHTLLPIEMAARRKFNLP